MMDINEQLKLIKRGSIDLISEDELIKKLKEKKKLRIKAGFDPTVPDLHLGHTIVMQKLRQFQDLGHTVIFLIGDYTARIGDPSGRSETRRMLDPMCIKESAKTYINQAKKILSEENLEVRYNSEWLEKLSMADLADIASRYTVARMLERDDFRKRHANGDDISMLEFIYPLMQGYDSVVLNADVELGGTDQIFNLLVGRALQRRFEKDEQVVLTMPLLVGTDGVQKMSKSYGNYIGISEAPEDIFGKLMSISDDLMWKYYELLSSKSLEEIGWLKSNVERGELHPKKAKEELAFELTTRFAGEKNAHSAKEHFEKVIVNKAMPDEIETKNVKSSEGKISLVDCMLELGLAKSKGEARRLIQQGGVSLDNNKISDVELALKKGLSHIIKKGKRFFIKVKII
ncbi:MAG: tyrosine--tRNA ligase [Pseudomonadota bacterium]